MILKTREQQEAFLRECHSHIKRIVKDIPACKRLNNTFINFKDPGRINLITNNKMYFLVDGKVLLLQEIFNKVSKLFSENQTSIDLDMIFRQVKADADPRLSELRNCYDSHTLMHTHRFGMLRYSWLRFLGRFFRPKSERFLKKYGFFDSLATPPIVSAVYSQSIDKLKAQISTHTIHERDNYGFGETALEIAAKFGFLPAVQLLLQHGAKASDRALTAAVKSCYVEVVNLLLKQGADLNAINSRGNMCVYDAIESLACWFYSPTMPLNMLSELIQKPIQWEKQQNHHHHGWLTMIYFLKQGYEKERRLDSLKLAKITAVFSRVLQTIGQYILLNPKTFSSLVLSPRDFQNLIEANPDAVEDFYELLLRNPKTLEKFATTDVNFSFADLKRRAPVIFRPVLEIALLDDVKTAAKKWLSNRDVKRVARLLWIGKRRNAPGFKYLNHDMIVKISAYTRDSEAETVKEAEITARLALTT